MDDPCYLDDLPPQFPLAYQYAGQMIQQWALAWPRNPEEEAPWFRWLVREPHLLFAHLVFAYRNQVFAVNLNLIENGQESLTEAHAKRLLEASETYHLIPCVIEVYCQGPHLHLNQALIDLRTGESIDPLLVSTEEPIECSAWELHHFAIQVVATEALTPKHYKIETTCSVPEINPQLWFRDSKGCLCWCLVRESRGEESTPLLEENVETFLAKHPQLQGYDGFFIGVCITSQESVIRHTDGTHIPRANCDTSRGLIYRGHTWAVVLTQLQQIHTAHFEC